MCTRWLYMLVLLLFIGHAGARVEVGAIMTCKLHGQKQMLSAAAWTVDNWRNLSRISGYGKTAEGFRYKTEKLHYYKCKDDECNDDSTSENAPLCKSSGWTKNYNYKMELPDTFGPVLDLRWEGFKMINKSPDKQTINVTHSYSVLTDEKIMIHINFTGNERFNYSYLATVGEMENKTRQVRSAFYSCNQSTSFDRCTQQVQGKQMKALDSRTWIHFTITLLKASENVRFTLKLYGNPEPLLQHSLGRVANSEIRAFTYFNGYLKKHQYQLWYTDKPEETLTLHLKPKCWQFIYYGNIKINSNFENKEGRITNFEPAELVYNRSHGDGYRIELRRFINNQDMNFNVTLTPKSWGKDLWAIGDIRQCTDEFREIRMEVPSDLIRQLRCTALSFNASQSIFVEMLPANKSNNSKYWMGHYNWFYSCLGLIVLFLFCTVATLCIILRNKSLLCFGDDSEPFYRRRASIIIARNVAIEVAERKRALQQPSGLTNQNYMLRCEYTADQDCTINDCDRIIDNENTTSLPPGIPLHFAPPIPSVRSENPSNTIKQLNFETRSKNTKTSDVYENYENKFTVSDQEATEYENYNEGPRTNLGKHDNDDDTIEYGNFMDHSTSVLFVKGNSNKTTEMQEDEDPIYDNV